MEKSKAKYAHSQFLKGCDVYIEEHEVQSHGETKKRVRNTHINPPRTETIPGMLSPSLISRLPDHSTDLCSLNGVVELSLPYKFTERRTWYMCYSPSLPLSLLINDLQEIQHACYSEWSAFSFYFYF